MASARMFHTATMLTNGMVLVAGGNYEDWDPESTNGWPSTAELFDPAANQFTVVATLEVRRSTHTTTLLPNGDLILAGGAGTNTLIERLHPENGNWVGSRAGHLLVPRKRHVACLVSGGRIVFAGGATDMTNSFAEVFDLESGTSRMLTNSGTQLQVLAASRGKVLLQGWLPGYVSAGEIYDCESNTFTAMAPPRWPDVNNQSQFL